MGHQALWNFEVELTLKKIFHGLQKSDNFGWNDRILSICQTQIFLKMIQGLQISYKVLRICGILQLLSCKNILEQGPIKIFKARNFG